MQPGRRDHFATTQWGTERPFTQATLAIILDHIPRIAATSLSADHETGESCILERTERVGNAAGDVATTWPYPERQSVSRET